MKKLSGVAVVTTAEGERVSYTYMELDGNGNITSQNNRGSFVALDDEVLAAIATLKNAVNARLEGGCPMTDNKRIKECKRKVIAAINEATLPFAVTELILENVLNAVRENMAAEEAAAANIETPKTEEEKMPN